MFVIFIGVVVLVGVATAFKVSRRHVDVKAIHQFKEKSNTVPKWAIALHASNVTCEFETKYVDWSNLPAHWWPYVYQHIITTQRIFELATAIEQIYPQIVNQKKQLQEQKNGIIVYSAYLRIAIARLMGVISHQKLTTHFQTQLIQSRNVFYFTADNNEYLNINFSIFDTVANDKALNTVMSSPSYKHLIAEVYFP